MSSDPSIDIHLEFSKSRLTKSEPFVLAGQELSAQAVIDLIRPLLTSERCARLEAVVASRSFSLVPVLENIYDFGNISAVMRSSEAFGFARVHLVTAPGARFKAANRVTKGAEKWLDVEIHRSPSDCVRQLKQSGFQVYATHLEAARPIAEIDFTRPTAVVFGNEKDGVSPEMLELVDGRFIIPMQGFSQSFNISVAAAIALYHGWHQRETRLGRSGDLTSKEQRILLANYYLRCLDNPESIVAQLLD